MKLFAQHDAEAFVKTGAREFRHDREIRLTPTARDILTEAGIKVVFQSDASASPSAPTSPAGGNDDEKLFNSKEAQAIKEQICDMGRRVWMREYCDGNGGNISARLAPDRFIVTPTGVSKGFMKPDMLCLVDIRGNQLAGTWKRSSEFMTHAAIYETVPEAASVCHAHPCHAGAFAVKGVQPPPRLIPELEVFVGTVAVAEYKTPGSPEMAESIRPLAPKHQSIIMGNHGVICWGKSVEDAYFKMEITDAYCRTVILAQSIPGSSSISGEGLGELLALKKKMGLPDDRYGLKPAELAEVDPWQEMCGSHGCSSPVTPWNPMTIDAGTPDPATEEVVRKIADEIMAKLK